MSLFSLPAEIISMITVHLQPHDLNSLIRSCHELRRMLNSSLYYDNVHHHNASALFWCGSSGNIRTLECLLNAGVKVVWDSTYQPFRPIALKKRGKQIEPTFSKHPISSAAANGHIDIVTRFIKLGVDANFKDPSGRNPLSLAAGGGHLKLSQRLLDCGADLLSLDSDGMYPTDHAAVQGHRDTEDFLFKEVQKLDKDSKQSSIGSILQQHLHCMLKHAVERGDNERARLLLFNHRIELNIIPYHLQGSLIPHVDSWYPTPWRSYTPLIGAIQSAPDPLSTTKILLENGADPNILVAIRNPFITNERLGMYENATSAALTRHESHSLIELLIQYGLNPTNSEMTLVRAAYLKKTDEFRLLVENGAYHSKVSGELCRIGHQPILDFLNQHIIQPEGQSPLSNGSILEPFDFDKFLERDCEATLGFEEEIRPQTPPPQTGTEWAGYLNGHMDDSPYPYYVGSAAASCLTGTIESWRLARGL